MGYYLNNQDAYTIFSGAASSPYFVDKSMIIDEIIPRIDTTQRFVCIHTTSTFWKVYHGKYARSFFYKSR